MDRQAYIHFFKPLKLWKSFVTFSLRYYIHRRNKHKVQGPIDSRYHLMYIYCCQCRLIYIFQRPESSPDQQRGKSTSMDPTAVAQHSTGVSSGCSPIEANPIEAKGKKGGNIPIQANPGNSVATFAWDYIPCSFNSLTLTLYVFLPILRVVCLLLCTSSRDFIAEKLVILYFNTIFG
jgi:hypothetical protein